MNAPVVIYHNPRCSKSRQALEILRANELEPQVVEYLKTPLDAMTLKDLLRKLRMGPRDIIRDGEVEYAKLKLADQSLSGEVLLAAIIKHPVLLQRPIVVRGNRAVVGRPPEKVKDLL